MVYASRWELDSPPRLNWDRMRTNKNKELERLSQLYMKQIETAGIHYVEGRGKLLDAHTVEVNGQKFTVRSLPCLVPWPQVSQIAAFIVSIFIHHLAM